MRERSEKRRKRENAARPARQALIALVGECEMCGARPVQGSTWAGRRLCVHEIVGGPHRQALLDRRHSTLVLCWLCNGGPAEDKSLWPEARQLALLKRSRPEDYDLAAHNACINPRAPRRVTEEEVRIYLEQFDGDSGARRDRGGGV